MEIESIIVLTLEDLKHVTKWEDKIYIKLTGLTRNQFEFITSEVPCVSCDMETMVIPGDCIAHVKDLFQ